MTDRNAEVNMEANTEAIGLESMGLQISHGISALRIFRNWGAPRSPSLWLHVVTTGSYPLFQFYHPNIACRRVDRQVPLDDLSLSSSSSSTYSIHSRQVDGGDGANTTNYNVGDV